MGIIKPMNLNHKKIIHRLKRANGQICGIAEMLEKGEDCEKILIQFLAAKAAVDKAFTETLLQGILQCDAKNQKKLLEKALLLLVKN
jgi:DNA-binding FrmR family transcriptional regulator